jgi:membrane protease YdiL (CAAX protease family)
MDNTAPVLQPKTPETSGEPVPAIRSGWARALLSVPAWFVTLLTCAVVTNMVLRLSSRPDTDLESATSGTMGIVVMLLQLAGTVLVVFVFRRFIDRRSVFSLGLNFSGRHFRDLVAGTLWGIALISTIFFVNYLAGGVTIMFLVGINEELYVRGYLLTNFMESTGKYVALLITSLIFSAFHLFNPNWSLIGLVNIILAGLLLGIYFVHRRNLWFPIGMHFSWNFCQGTVYGSRVSGVTTPSLLQTQFSGSELLTGGEFGLEASLVTTAAIAVLVVLVHLIYRPRPANRSQIQPPA